MHKEGNPGYPVVSSINCHTANILEYIDYHLQPIVKEISSYVKDTNFINKINTGRSVPQSSSGYEVIIYKYTKHRTNISCKESIQQVLKESYNRKSYHNVLGINTYSTCSE